MASIAAISHVEVKTKLTDKELGSHLIISGSQIKKLENALLLTVLLLRLKIYFTMFLQDVIF